MSKTTKVSVIWETDKLDVDLLKNGVVSGIKII